MTTVQQQQEAGHARHQFSIRTNWTPASRMAAATAGTEDGEPLLTADKMTLAAEAHAAADL